MKNYKIWSVLIIGLLLVSGTVSFYTLARAQTVAPRIDTIVNSSGVAGQVSPGGYVKIRGVGLTADVKIPGSTYGAVGATVTDMNRRVDFKIDSREKPGTYKVYVTTSAGQSNSVSLTIQGSGSSNNSGSGSDSGSNTASSAKSNALPTVSGVTLNGSASRINLPQGDSLHIGFNVINFGVNYSSPSNVMIQICKPNGPCAYLGQKYIGTGSGALSYDVSGVGLSNASYWNFLDTEGKAQIKICPIVDVVVGQGGDVPSEAICGWSGYFLVGKNNGKPEISLVWFDDDGSSTEWVPGASKKINFVYRNFKDDVKKVLLSICNPDNTNVCQDLVLDNLNLSGGGVSSVTKSIGSQVYQRLENNDSAITPYYRKDVDAYRTDYVAKLKIRPVTSAGAVPADAIFPIAYYLPFLTISDPDPDTPPETPDDPAIYNIGWGDLPSSWPAGEARTIYWQHNDFSSGTNNVVMSLCHPTDDSKCASWTNFPATTAGVNDILSAGANGRGTAFRGLPSTMYTTSGSSAFFVNRQARMKICPSNSNGVIPSGSSCDFSSIFTVMPQVVTPSVTVSASPKNISTLLTSGSATNYTPVTTSISWQPSNLPTGATCTSELSNSNIDNSYPGFYTYVSSASWVIGGSLSSSGGNKNVSILRPGIIDFVVKCSAGGNNYVGSTTVIASDPTITAPTVTGVSIEGDTGSQIIWPAGNPKKITWTYAGFNSKVGYVSFNLCHPDSKDASGKYTKCISYSPTDPSYQQIASGYNQGESSDPAYRNKSMGAITRDQGLGLKIYSRLSGTTTDSMKDYFKTVTDANGYNNYQSVLAICPTASWSGSYNGISYVVGTTPQGAKCGYSPAFTVVDPNFSYSPTWNLPSGQGCFVGECVCVNNKIAKCGNPMSSGVGCPVMPGCTGGTYTVSMADKMMASVYSIGDWILSLFR